MPFYDVPFSSSFSSSVTFLLNLIVTGWAAYNIGTGHWDGVVFNLSAGGAARGFQANASFALYFDFQTLSLYFYAGPEVGTAPLSALKSWSGKFSWGITGGLAFNTDGGEGLSGGSINANWPIFVFPRVASFLVRGLSSQEAWINFVYTMAQYQKGANIVNSRGGAVVFSQSLTGPTASVSYGPKQYSYSTTVSYYFGPWRLQDFRRLLAGGPDGFQAGIQRVADLIPHSKNAFDTPEKFAAVLNRITDALETLSS